MASTIELEAASRAGVGKGAARQSRRDGFVPGVVYGGNVEPKAIQIRENILLKLLKAGNFMSTLIKISIDGEEQTVICRAVQRDVVRDLPIHADFLRLSERSRITLAIPVRFVNEDEAPGLKKGGVLTVVRNEVDLKVRADAIPEALEIDLSGLDFNDAVRASDLALPPGTALTITDRDFMIANISAPSVIAADDEEEDGEDAEEPTDGAPEEDGAGEGEAEE